MKVYDYIKCVDKRFRFAIFKGMKMLSPLVVMHLLDRSCMIVGIFLKLLHSPTIVKCDNVLSILDE